MDGPSTPPASKPRWWRRRIVAGVALVLAVVVGVSLWAFEPWRLWTRNTVIEALPTAAGPAVPAGQPGPVTVAPMTAPAPALVPATTASPATATPKPAAPKTSAPRTSAPKSSAEPTADESTAVAQDGAPQGPTASSAAAITSSTVATEPAKPEASVGTEPPVRPQAPAEPAAPAEPVVLAEGSFLTQEHQTTGTVKILQLADGSRYVRLEGFSTTDGPDLRVAITDQQAGGEWGKYENGRYLEVGELKGTDGDQNYLIPADADLSGLTSVVIWCIRFSVAFGSAPVQL